MTSGLLASYRAHASEVLLFATHRRRPHKKGSACLTEHPPGGERPEITHTGSPVGQEQQKKMDFVCLTVSVNPGDLMNPVCRPPPNPSRSSEPETLQLMYISYSPGDAPLQLSGPSNPTPSPPSLPLRPGRSSPSPSQSPVLEQVYLHRRTFPYRLSRFVVCV